MLYHILMQRESTISRNGIKIAFRRAPEIVIANCDNKYIAEYPPLGIRIQADRRDTAMRYMRNKLFDQWQKYCTVPERALNQRGRKKRDHFREIIAYTTYQGSRTDP